MEKTIEFIKDHPKEVCKVGKTVAEIGVAAAAAAVGGKFAGAAVGVIGEKIIDHTIDCSGKDSVGSHDHDCIII